MQQTYTETVARDHSKADTPRSQQSHEAALRRRPYNETWMDVPLRVLGADMLSNIISVVIFVVLMAIMLATVGPAPTVAFGVSSLVLTGLGAYNDTKDD